MRRIGSCSLCGGDVNVFTGPFFGTPPPPTCSRCNAVRDDAPEVVPMRQRPTSESQREQLLQQGAGNLCMQLGRNS